MPRSLLSYEDWPGAPCERPAVGQLRPVSREAGLFDDVDFAKVLQLLRLQVHRDPASPSLEEAALAMEEARIKGYGHATFTAEAQVTLTTLELQAFVRWFYSLCSADRNRLGAALYDDPVKGTLCMYTLAALLVVAMGEERANKEVKDAWVWRELLRCPTYHAFWDTAHDLAEDM